MLKKNFFLLFFLVFAISCIDSYNVEVKNHENLLVVDALITNENKSHTVKLSRSIKNLDEVSKMETNAFVSIVCSDGAVESLKEVDPGIYVTDSLKFVVEVGKKYQLLISTSNGSKYSSNECEILEPTEFDRVFYKKNEKVTVNNEVIEGVSFFVDGRAVPDAYLRWIFEEDWKFSIAYPTRIGFDENEDMIYIPIKNYYCWKNSISNEIITQSLKNQNSTEIKGKEVCFVPSDNNDRFTYKYAIKIKQLHISQMEFEFWNKLKESSENVGDVFGTQPFSVEGNIKADGDKSERVLGYFQAVSVVSKRIFIDYTDVANLELTLKNTGQSCPLDTVLVNKKNPTLYKLYEEFVLNKGFSLYDKLDDENKIGLLLSRQKCSDCSLTGSNEKPSFWED